MSGLGLEPLDTLFSWKFWAALVVVLVGVGVLIGRLA